MSKGSSGQDNFEVMEDLMLEGGLVVLGSLTKSMDPDDGVLVFGLGHDDGGVFLHVMIIIYKYRCGCEYGKNRRWRGKRWKLRKGRRLKINGDLG